MHGSSRVEVFDDADGCLTAEYTRSTLQKLHLAMMTMLHAHR
jgi:hypothetical protein